MYLPDAARHIVQLRKSQRRSIEVDDRSSPIDLRANGLDSRLKRVVSRKVLRALKHLWCRRKVHREIAVATIATRVVDEFAQCLQCLVLATTIWKSNQFLDFVDAQHETFRSDSLDQPE